MPQSWPVALNASGGAPTDTSRRNWCCRAQTSALSPSTMNGRSPNSCDAVRARVRALPATARRRATADTAGTAPRRASSRRARSIAAGLAALQLRRGHSVHGRSPLARVQRAEQAVVLDPPRLLADARAQRRARGRCRAATRRRETVERRAQRGVLQPADRRVVDARRGADRGRARSRSAGDSAASPPSAANSGTPRHADEDRIDRHRADRGVRRLLAGRHLVERQQLQHAHARRRRATPSTAATSPMSPMPQLAVDGHENSGTSRPARRRRRRRLMRGSRVQSKCRSTRPTPSRERVARRQQTDDEERFAREVEKVTRDARARRPPSSSRTHEIFLGLERRHLQHRVPAAVARRRRGTTAHALAIAPQRGGSSRRRAPRICVADRGAALEQPRGGQPAPASTPTDRCRR